MDVVSMVWSQAQTTILSTPVYPFLWLPHCVIMSLALRATLGSQSQALQFARAHILTCYSLGILYTFSGALTGLILSNQSVLTILTWSNNLYSFTIVWYLMFYGPGDCLYRFLTKFPITPFLVIAQDWLRLANVRKGVLQSVQDRPDFFLYPVVFASCTSNGFMFLKYLERCLQTGFKEAAVVKHHSAKTMVVTAILLTAQARGVISIQAEDVYCSMVMVTAVLRLVTTFLVKDWDPYCTAETQVCRLLYGDTVSVDEETRVDRDKSDSRVSRDKTD